MVRRVSGPLVAGDLTVLNRLLIPTSLVPAFIFSALGFNCLEDGTAAFTAEEEAGVLLVLQGVSFRIEGEYTKLLHFLFLLSGQRW